MQMFNLLGFYERRYGNQVTIIMRMGLVVKDDGKSAHLIFYLASLKVIQKLKYDQIE